MFCGKKNSKKLEKIQERALRFVYNDVSSPYSDLLKRGNFLSLSALRIRFLAIEMYKCTNSLAPSYLCDLFKPRAIKYKLRDPHRLLQPEFNTIRFGYKSFTYYGSKLWNSLPPDIKDSDSLYIFKRRISLWCHSTKCDELIIDWQAI